MINVNETFSGVIDVNGSVISSEDMSNHLLQQIDRPPTNEQIDGDKVYLIPHSLKPINEYFNPTLLLGLYPTLFCYGRGAPEDQSRPVHINFREHIRYLLSYNDRRFEKNHSFLFVVFNLLQRRQACFQAQLIATRPYFETSAHEIQSLSSKDIEMALKLHSAKAPRVELSGTLNKLLQHVRTVGGRVMGSAYGRTALRTRLHALIYNQGLPSIFLTINPADIHSPVVLYLAGVNVDLDNIRMQQMLDTYRRAEIVASHPVATAKFFHILISHILNHLLVGGLLGPLKAYFGTVESQGRGSLHLHLLAWLNHDMKPADLKEKIQDLEFREKLIAYLEDIVKEDLDEFRETQASDKTDGKCKVVTQSAYGLHWLVGTSAPMQQRRLSRDDICSALQTMVFANSTGSNKTDVATRSSSRTRRMPSSNSRATTSSQQVSSSGKNDRVESSNLLRFIE